MRKHTLRLLAVSATYFALSPAVAANATAGTPAAVSTTATTNTDRGGGATAAVPATRIASRFEGLAGSPENAASLVAGLHSGTAITLTSPTTSPTGIRLTPTTKPMGYGNVTQALTLAQRQLAAQGIIQPTPAQLSTALNGGTLTTSSSGATRTVEMAGVLQLRSQGMGWGQIAHRLSVSPGNPPEITTTPTGTSTASMASTTQGRTSLRDVSYGRGAMVSGDGVVMQGRVPGYSSATEPREPSSGTAQAQANVKVAVHARMPVIQAGGSASLGGGHAPETAGNHGKSFVQARSNGRL